MKRPSRLFLTWTFLLGSVRLLVAPPVEAQDPPGLAFELRAGASLPTGDYAGAGGFEGAATSAPSYGAALTLRLAGPLALRAGFSEMRFSCGNDSACGGEEEVIVNGFDLGLDLRWARDRWMPFLRGGLIAHIVEAPIGPQDGLGGGGTELAERAFGWEAGAGIRFALTERWAVAPVARLGALSTDLPTPGEVELDFWALELAFVLDF